MNNHVKILVLLYNKAADYIIRPIMLYIVIFLEKYGCCIVPSYTTLYQILHAAYNMQVTIKFMLMIRILIVA